MSDRRCPIHPQFPIEDCPPCERRAEERESAREEPDEDRLRAAEDRYEREIESHWP